MYEPVPSVTSTCSVVLTAGPLKGFMCGKKALYTVNAKVGNLEVKSPVCLSHKRQVSEHNRSHASERVGSQNLTAPQRV